MTWGHRDAVLFFPLPPRLQLLPIISKPLHFSGILSALGNLLSQALECRKKKADGNLKKDINVLGPARFAVYGYVHFDRNPSSVFQARSHFKYLWSSFLTLRRWNSSACIDGLFAARSRLCFTGPLSHFFYQLLELLFPSTVPYCIVKRLLLDRLVFAPAFLLLFFFVMNVLEVSPAFKFRYLSKKQKPDTTLKQWD